MRIETLPIAQLNPARYNPRVALKPGMPEYDMLAKGIDTFGLVEPLVVNESTGWTVVGGHQRLSILKARGETHVECSIVDLSEGEEKALNIALNKLAGKWDLPKLKDLLEELDIGVLDMDLTGFSEAAIGELMSQFNTEEPPTRDGKTTTCPSCGLVFELHQSP
jgi:ParB-like chromosome segregation protein Spo0J